MEGYPGAVMTRPLVLCLVNEAWFFRSHFLPWARIARAEGFDVSVLAAADAEAAGLAREGIRFVPSRATRGGLMPRGLWAAAGQVKGLVAGRQAVLLHAFGLHGMAIASLARLRGVRLPLAISVTGLGFLAAKGGPARLAGGLLARLPRLFLDGPTTCWLLENSDDGPRMGLAGAARSHRLTILTGAGVDPSAFAMRAMPPPPPPLKLILVARMVRSKGVDLAVAAVTRVREAGIDVTLSLAGAPDPANPASYDAAELAAFAATAGVQVLGRRNDVADLLADHHLFILPSRGGEGLPKALLEAAAAGRPAIVTDVPGCREFVSDGETGFVAAGTAEALADAIRRAADADLAAMGRAARARAEKTGTVAIVGGQVVASYRKLLGRHAAG